MNAPPPRRDAFGDPATGLLYVWARNHDEEQSAARIRSIENTQPTIGRWRNVRPIRVQGARDELVYKLAGKIPTLDMHRWFLTFVAMSMRHTIYFFHASGERFECQLSDYEPQRRYDPGKREHYAFDYTIQLDVVRLLPGPPS